MTDGLRIEQIKQNLQPQNVEENRRAKSSPPADTAGSGAGTQALQFSPQAQDVRDALQVLRHLPDVREQKIKDLQNKLAQGQLNVIPEILAQKLLERIFPSD